MNTNVPKDVVTEALCELLQLLHYDHEADIASSNSWNPKRYGERVGFHVAEVMAAYDLYHLTLATLRFMMRKHLEEK